MNYRNNLLRAVACVSLLFAVACQKKSQPALPKDYPTDNVTLPPGPLRFYLPFDSTKAQASQLNIRFADSISTYPSFFPDPSVTYTTGVSGTAYQGSYSNYLHYYSANDFPSATSFTISFWIKASIDQKDHKNADAVLSLSSTTNFWSNLIVFVDHESSTADSMVLKFHFADGTGDNWNFQYAGNQRIPGMYDNNWHQIAFTYDAGAATGTLYVDGAQYDKKTNQSIKFDGNASQFVVGGFQEAVNIVDSYANNPWMSGWPGALDNIRLYNTALSASDVQALYTNKQ